EEQERGTMEPEREEREPELESAAKCKSAARGRDTQARAKPAVASGDGNPDCSEVGARSRRTGFPQQVPEAAGLEVRAARALGSRRSRMKARLPLSRDPSGPLPTVVEAMRSPTAHHPLASAELGARAATGMRRAHYHSVADSQRRELRPSGRCPTQAKSASF